MKDSADSADLFLQLAELETKRFNLPKLRKDGKPKRSGRNKPAFDHPWKKTFLRR